METVEHLPRGTQIRYLGSMWTEAVVGYVLVDHGDRLTLTVRKPYEEVWPFAQWVTLERVRRQSITVST